MYADWKCAPASVAKAALPHDVEWKEPPKALVKTKEERELHEDIMAKASQEVANNMAWQLKRTGSDSLRGALSIQMTITKYAELHPSWKLVTVDHLRRWAKNRPGEKPLKENKHLRMFSDDAEKAFAEAAGQACDNNEGMSAKMLREFIWSHLTDEQLRVFKNGCVSKDAVKGIHRRMEAKNCSMSRAPNWTRKCALSGGTTTITNVTTQTWRA